MNEKIDRNFQYCIEPIIEYVEVNKEVIVEKKVEIPEEVEIVDVYPTFHNVTKQNLFMMH